MQNNKSNCNPLSDWSGLSTGQRFFLLGWLLTLLTVALLAAAVLVGQQWTSLETAQQRHAARIGSDADAPGLTPAERTPPPGHENDLPVEVGVGIYLDRIAEVSIIGSSWKADFYIWFNWNDNIADPGESFQVVNGEILTKTLMERQEDGQRRYALYRVTAHITKNFDTTRFPRDDHLLTIAIEDAARQSYQLRYVTAANASDISSRVAIPGYRIADKAVTIKPHSYKTARGNPNLPANFRATYSQFSLNVAIARPSWGLFVKLTVILYAAVAMALFALFIRASGDRLALQTGAMFAAAANAYITSSLIPDAGVATLADYINWVGIACIGICLLEGVIYQYHFEGVEERSRMGALLDQATFALAAVSYIGINVAVALAASY